MSKLRKAAKTAETIDDSSAASAAPETPVPGLLLVFEPSAQQRSGAGSPALRPVSVYRDSVAIGRSRAAEVPLDDERVSGVHATVRYDGSTWHVTDHKSRNGTFVDGARVQGELGAAAPRVLRVGHTVFLFSDDVRCFLRGGGVREEEGAVVGPRLRERWGAIKSAAQQGDTTALIGESGTGKEVAARVFHRAGPHPDGPLVAVNCAAIPAALAERLLFGARRGAYSGADQDADGYVQAADGGTLFLDEIAELDLDVQAKLLRCVETREVTPLGATRSSKVDVRICCATQAPLGEAVSAGDFRKDLYYRIGRPEVTLPALRQRPEEIPWLMRHTVAAAAHGEALELHASLVEALLMRPWPGNVRELVAEVRRAALRAVGEGAATVGLEHIEASAGAALEGASDAPFRSASGTPPDDDAIAEALRVEGGNVSAAARRLGMHRTQLRRWLDKNDKHHEEGS